MRLTDVPDLLARVGDFPTEHETLAESVDDVDVEAPNGETTALATALARSDDDRYRSAREAYTAVLANVGEDFVGRKRYDDRSSVTHHPATPAHSF